MNSMRRSERALALLVLGCACGGGGAGGAAGARTREAAEVSTARDGDAPGGDLGGGNPEPGGSDGADAKPATDFQVEGVLGALDDAAVQRAVAAASEALQGCYQRNVGGLRYIRGKADVLVRVARDGSIKRAQVGDGDLGSWPIEKCLVAVARGMAFGKPRGGEGEVRIPLEFASAVAPDVMDPDRAQREMAPKLRAFAGCPRGPKSYEVTVYLGAGGRVTSAGFESDGAEGIPEAWGDCAWERALKWTMSDPRGKPTKAKGKR
jgi:hypothetical protein